MREFLSPNFANEILLICFLILSKFVKKKKLCKWPTKVVHTTYCARPTKLSWASDLSFVPVLLRLFIRPKKSVHSIYKTVHLTYLNLCVTGKSILLEELSIIIIHTDVTSTCSCVIGRINKIECTSDLQLS